MTAALLLLALATSANLQVLLDEARQQQDVPGISAIVVHRDAIVFAGASGVADLESAQAMTPDSVLYIGSVSKVLTAVLALQLVEEGKLSLHEPLELFSTEAAGQASSITVSHLLSHSAGLPREGNFGYWFTADFPDSEALTRYLATIETRAAPGASLHYSNIGYAALGMVVENVSQQHYGDALRSRVLEPLHMRASGARGPATNISNGYTPPNRLLPTPQRPFAGVGKRVGDRYERTYHDARAMSPAFGAYSSAQDLGKLAVFLLGYGGNDVLSATLRSHMYQPQASGWGSGLKIGRLGSRRVARHDGWFAAHRSHLLLDRENEIGVAVLANGDNAETGGLAEALLENALLAIDYSENEADARASIN